MGEQASGPAPGAPGEGVVSVIIPVLDQPDELLLCLEALAAQTCSHGAFEVVVVDNASATPIAPLVGRFAFARSVCETAPGSYAARNAGVAQARGELLAFTDADCLPSRDWIARGARALQRLPAAGMVAGRIDLMVSDAGRRTAAELYETIFGFPQDVFIEWGFAATANMFTSREAWERVGPFDAGLKSGGDMEWGQRLRDLGLAQAYDETVRVGHRARRRLPALLRKSIRVAGGVQDVAEKRGEGVDGLLSYARQQLLQLWKIRGSWSDPRLASTMDRVKFAFAVWLVELVQVIERFRVHHGGRSRRT